MTIADRDRLTAMVLAAMKASMKRVGPGHYPGGPSQLLSDLLFAWGIVATPETLKNRTSGRRRQSAAQRFATTALRHVPGPVVQRVVENATPKTTTPSAMPIA